ncbi:hypothetical protein TSOC_000302 [Tetrabaena socialis]|uniref:CHRD domain-containing protein n=1 Tax=Tetrabaena socialis TaxID=47790 RepID=A0A2J8AJS8_9CHLO|nr:hypothetical protein TSOC_000302 [Tetrabaena socialis]|eukprot:PNH12774.1 hypothetical protein TSOC_000302 [Tetrabaena socialis]
MKFAILASVALCLALSALSAEARKNGPPMKHPPMMRPPPKMMAPMFPPAPMGSVVAQAALGPTGTVMSMGKGMVRLVMGPNSMHSLDVMLMGTIPNVTMAHVHVGDNNTAGPVALAVLPYLMALPLSTINPAVSFKGELMFTVPFTSADLAAFSGVAGVTPAAAEASFRQLLSQAMLYFNVHTMMYPGGEIRGNFACVAKDCAPMM